MAKTDGYTIEGTCKDIGSGLSDNRQGFKKLIRDCYKNNDNITRLYITFRDRLTRFGTKNFGGNFLSSWN